MTQTNTDLIERFILDYYFDHVVGSFEDIAAHVSSKVRVNSSAALYTAISNKLHTFPYIRETARGNFSLVTPCYYSESRGEWQSINEMNVIHICNALKKMLRDGTILQRRTEAHYMLNKLKDELYE